jgi:hypothetical protein
MSLNDWTDIKQLGCAAEYKKRAYRKSSYPIWACDFSGDCIVGAGKYILKIVMRFIKKLSRDVPANYF